jgi:hypothetical protein
MEEEKQILQKIKALMGNADKFKPMQFRMALEELVKQGAQGAEHLLVSYMTEAGLNPELRMDIIRVAGYLQRPSFLIPLKKIIDTVQHSRIQKEAIISVSKFNDRRALNILNHALSRINNPMLMSTINAEISRIKENNPILALMPRFQEGQKNPKTFKVALQILKRILTAKDAQVFTKFLASPDPLIQQGAFEILCSTGDIMFDSDILGYFKSGFSRIPCIAEKECEALYMMTYHIKGYIIRYQFLVEEQVPVFREMFAQTGDIRVKQLLLSMICKSKKQEAISFVEDTYPDHEKLQESIIEELAGNEISETFLFGLFHDNGPHKERVIQSLLAIKNGLDYFIREFFGLPFEDQEVVVQHLPYSGEHDLTEFIKDVFQADIYRLKEHLMSKIKENYEFSVKKLLFDPNREREFSFMGKDYFQTITRLFPVSSVKMLLAKLLHPEVSVSKAKKFLQMLEPIMAQELVLNFKDKEFITRLFTKVVNSNNREFTLQFLGLLKFIKTLDIDTYRILNESLSLFITKRETSITPQEKGELTRIKRNFHDLFMEFKRVEEGTAAFKRLSGGKEELDLQLLERAMTSHHLAFVMKQEEILGYISDLFESGSIAMEDWAQFFSRFPMVTRLLYPAIRKKLDGQHGTVYGELLQLVESFSSEPPRLVLNFHNRQITAVLREEFAEAAPEVDVAINLKDMRDTDTLLCDTPMLKDLALDSIPLPPKIYLFLENLEGFAELKKYNPKTFVQPFTYYRIVKDILRALYL